MKPTFGRDLSDWVHEYTAGRSMADKPCTDREVIEGYLQNLVVLLAMMPDARCAAWIANIHECLDECAAAISSAGETIN